MKTQIEFLEWLGLKIGDRVLFNGNKEITYLINYVTDSQNSTKDSKIYLINEKYDNIMFTLGSLIDHNFEILPKEKVVGDMTCMEIKECIDCPLTAICHNKLSGNPTLYEQLTHNAALSNLDYDKEVYDLFKNRLNKKVKQGDVKNENKAFNRKRTAS